MVDGYTPEHSIFDLISPGLKILEIFGLPAWVGFILTFGILGLIILFIIWLKKKGFI